jgi:hypothetical protein
VSGVVVAAQARWHERLLAAVVYALIRLVGVTLRRQAPELHPLALVAMEGRVIFCTWHNRLALALETYRVYMQRRDPGRRLAALVSASRDGALVARVLELAGAQPVRGSTSRRGPQAMLELTTVAERGFDIAIIPDGPRGPCYQVQPGIIAVAQVTGLPIIPVGDEVSWCRRAKGWDRFRIPLPFGRWRVLAGTPLRVPRDASADEREQLRTQLEQELRRLNPD